MQSRGIPSPPRCNSVDETLRARYALLRSTHESNAVEIKMLRNPENSLGGTENWESMGKAGKPTKHRGVKRVNGAENPI